MLNWQVRIVNVAREGSPGTTEPTVATHASLAPETCVAGWLRVGGRMPRPSDSRPGASPSSTGSAAWWASVPGPRHAAQFGGAGLGFEPGPGDPESPPAPARVTPGPTRSRRAARPPDGPTRSPGPSHPVRGLHRTLGERRRHTTRGGAELRRDAPAR